MADRRLASCSSRASIASRTVKRSVAFVFAAPQSVSNQKQRDELLLLRRRRLALTACIATHGSGALWLLSASQALKKVGTQRDAKKGCNRAEIARSRRLYKAGIGEKVGCSVPRGRRSLSRSEHRLLWPAIHRSLFRTQHPARSDQNTNEKRST